MNPSTPAAGQAEDGRPENLSVMPKRLVALRGPLTRRTAMLAVNRLLYLAAEKSTTPVPMEINSPGGPMAHCSEILGVMHGVRYPIATFCRGEVRGAALILAAHGRPGWRAATAGCRFSFSSKWAEAKHGWVPEQVSERLGKVVRDPSGLLGWLDIGGEFGSEEALRCGLIDAISARPVFSGSGPAGDAKPPRPR
jgi:ATP-dependent protease ClpP protease subunit